MEHACIHGSSVCMSVCLPYPYFVWHFTRHLAGDVTKCWTKTHPRRSLLVHGFSSSRIWCHLRPVVPITIPITTVVSDRQPSPLISSSFQQHAVGAASSTDHRSESECHARGANQVLHNAPSFITTGFSRLKKKKRKRKEKRATLPREAFSRHCFSSRRLLHISSALESHQTAPLDSFSQAKSPISPPAKAGIRNTFTQANSTTPRHNLFAETSPPLLFPFLFAASRMQTSLRILPNERLCREAGRRR
ncbi:hypothetical protein J3F83DRAFT_499034 [Trichoderma novae-zelandiae]